MHEVRRSRADSMAGRAQASGQELASKRPDTGHTLYKVKRNDLYRIRLWPSTKSLEFYQKYC
jgi:hypothetical protein